MCGWLPFQKTLTEFISNSDAAEDVHENKDPISPRDVNHSMAKACLHMREELGIPPQSELSMSFQRTPLFLAHGVEDHKVNVNLGREATNCLMAMGMDVQWKEYEGLGHWYSSKMLYDLVTFVHEETDWGKGDS